MVDKKAIADEAKAAQKAVDKDVKSQLGTMKPHSKKGWARGLF